MESWMSLKPGQVGKFGLRVMSPLLLKKTTLFDFIISITRSVLI